MLYKLDMLGWTQDEIGECVDLERSSVSKIVNSGDFAKIHTFVPQGESMQWIAEHYGLDLTTTWALRLKDDTDEDRGAA